MVTTNKCKMNDESKEASTYAGRGREGGKGGTNETRHDCMARRARAEAGEMHHLVQACQFDSLRSHLGTHGNNKRQRLDCSSVRLLLCLALFTQTRSTSPFQNWIYRCLRLRRKRMLD